MAEIMLHYLLACHFVSTPTGNYFAFKHADDPVSNFKYVWHVV